MFSHEKTSNSKQTHKHTLLLFPLFSSFPQKTFKVSIFLSFSLSLTLFSYSLFLHFSTKKLKPFTQGSFTSLFFSNMGFSHSDLESESKKWVIAGIGVRSLKPINTKRVGGDGGGGDAENEEEEARSTTPTAKEARIPEKLPCPPAPRKRRPPPSRCGNGGGGGVREFFTPPDLESVFKCHVEKAK